MDAAGGSSDRGSPSPSADAGDDASTTDGAAADAITTSDGTGGDDASGDGPALAESGVDAPLTGAYSLSFDGQRTYVDCGNFPIPADFTLEAWVNAASFVGETYVMAQDRDTQGPGQFRFGFIAGGQVFFQMSDQNGNSYGLWSSGTQSYALQSPSAVPTGTWTEVAVTKSGASFSLLVNGTVVASRTATQAFSWNDGGMHNPFRIGARVAADGSSPGGVFDGLVDEVRFWKAGRTPAQIAADMRREIVMSDADWNTMLDYWPIDEGSGNKTKDRGGPHDGTLQNGPLWSTQTPF